jgi:hypothetical protein
MANYLQGGNKGVEWHYISLRRFFMKHCFFLVALMFFVSSSSFAAVDPLYPCACAKGIKGYKGCNPYNVAQCIVEGNPEEALRIIKNADKTWTMEQFNMVHGGADGAKAKNNEPGPGCGIVSMLAYYPATEYKDNKKIPISEPNKLQVAAIEEILTRISDTFLADKDIKTITSLGESDQYATPDTRSVASISGKGTGYKAAWEYRKSAMNDLCKTTKLLKPAEQAVISNNVNFIAALAKLKANEKKLLFTIVPIESNPSWTGHRQCITGGSGNTIYAFIVSPLATQDFMMLDNYMPVESQCNSVDGYMPINKTNPYKNISILQWSNVFKEYEDRRGTAGVTSIETHGSLNPTYTSWEKLPVSVQNMAEMLAKVTAPTKTASGSSIYVSPTYEGGEELLAAYYNGSCPKDKLNKQFPLIPYDIADLVTKKYSPTETTGSSTVKVNPCEI